MINNDEEKRKNGLKEQDDNSHRKKMEVET